MYNLMSSYFGPKTQYKDAEFDIVKTLENTTEHAIKTYKVESYLELEEILNNDDFDYKLNWYLDELDKCLSDKDIKPDRINDIHDVFNLKYEDLIDYLKVILRQHAKHRTLVLYGKSNSGKSLIANALYYPFAPGMIQRAGTTNVHWLEAIYQKNFILWEEPSVDMSTIEDVKLLTGGETIVINRKNKNLIERLKGPAVLVTTNIAFWNYRYEELTNRCIIKRFSTPIKFKQDTIYTDYEFAYYIFYILKYSNKDK